MKYKIKSTNKFKKNFQLCIKRGYDGKLLNEVVDILEIGEKLPAKYNQHKLKGKFKDCWECYITSDWLLIWQQKDIRINFNTNRYRHTF